MFSAFWHRYFQRNMSSKNHYLLGLGVVFDRQKICQNYDFSAPCETAFRTVKTMVFEGFGSSKVIENKEKNISVFEQKTFNTKM